MDGSESRFSWKADGNYFVVNLGTDRGRKCHTRDHMMGVFRSPARSDATGDGLVQSVSEKSWAGMKSVVAWQPSAGIIAGADCIVRNGVEVNRVIFWEKNGLRHL